MIDLTLLKNDLIVWYNLTDEQIKIKRIDKPKLTENPDGGGEYKRINYIEIKIYE